MLPAQRRPGKHCTKGVVGSKNNLREKKSEVFSSSEGEEALSTENKFTMRMLLYCFDNLDPQIRPL